MSGFIAAKMTNNEARMTNYFSSALSVTLCFNFRFTLSPSSSRTAFVHRHRRAASPNLHTHRKLRPWHDACNMQGETCSNDRYA
ncbi:MAG TPA: hypothetical protein VEA63_02050, partial [Opitutus sp.]|nr:hypothetical protein [Opitutus sp.]